MSQASRERHHETCSRIAAERERCDRALAGIQELMADFRRIAHGMLMLGDRPPRSVDEAIAIGERLSALLMAEYLEAVGHPGARDQRRGGDRYRRGLRKRHAHHGSDAQEGATTARAAAGELAFCPW